MALVCSTQPENPGTPPFWTEVSIIRIASQERCQSFCKDGEEYFHLDIEQRAFSKLVDCLGIPFLWCKYSFPLLLRGWNISFCQTTFKSLDNHLKSSGHILYTLYGMALGPGAEAVLAFWTTSFTFPNDDSETSSCFSGAFTGSIRSQSPCASSRLGSKWVTLRYFSTASSYVFQLP